ncbi:hypothetical protein [Tunicatimonas pelagia]|uniref:hypothetical protein n=1 Tax=Tunicatimonas pelagia TaxID=931531 RepID=UPI0026666E68|nr:hypothetical protein [Tunicatimonas pelagia]WKN45512.1 hypothetical protein P0M28_11145 [Tunicatimonas pelagia]
MEFNLQHWDSALESEKIPALNLDYRSDRLWFSYLYPVTNQNNWAGHVGFSLQTIGVAFGELVAAELQQKISVAGRVNFQLHDRHAINSQLSVPLLLFVFGNLDTDFYPSHRYQGYIFNVAYHYSLSNRFDLVAQFHSRYDRLKSENIFRELQNRVAIGVDFKF